MSLSVIGRKIDQACKHADRLYGLKGTFIDRASQSVDITTGVQTSTNTTCDVVVRSWPLTLKERVDMAQAGLQQVDAKFSMRAAYAANVEPGDLLQVNSFTYEVIPQGAMLDEHNVEWTIFTRRRRN